MTLLQCLTYRWHKHLSKHCQGYWLPIALNIAFATLAITNKPSQNPITNDSVVNIVRQKLSRLKQHRHRVSRLRPHRLRFQAEVPQAKPLQAMAHMLGLAKVHGLRLYRLKLYGSQPGVGAVEVGSNKLIYSSL